MIKVSHEAMIIRVCNIVTGYVIEQDAGTNMLGSGAAQVAANAIANIMQQDDIPPQGWSHYITVTAIKGGLEVQPTLLFYDLVRKLVDKEI